MPAGEGYCLTGKLKLAMYMSKASSRSLYNISSSLINRDMMIKKMSRSTYLRTHPIVSNGTTIPSCSRHREMRRCDRNMTFRSQRLISDTNYVCESLPCTVSSAGCILWHVYRREVLSRAGCSKRWRRMGGWMDGCVWECGAGWMDGVERGVQTGRCGRCFEVGSIAALRDDMQWCVTRRGFGGYSTVVYSLSTAVCVGCVNKHTGG